MVTVRQIRGFSLIEILVAFSITAVALTIIFQIYAKGATTAILGREYAQAVAVAESKLAESVIYVNDNNKETRGTENDKYNWVADVEDYTPADATDFVPVLELVKVKVEVTWSSRGKTHSVTLHSLRPRAP